MRTFVCVLTGVFVSLTMSMSTLSVITTVLVLYLHHSTWLKPVPRWLQTLAFSVLARALCMRLPLTPVSGPGYCCTRIQHKLAAKR